MTCAVQTDCGTQFGGWLRRQEELDSSLGFAATDIDFVWRNWKTGDFMLIEEKRGEGRLTEHQRRVFTIINERLVGTSGYKGFHLLWFEHTNPEFGRIEWDGFEITKEDLIRKLRFEE